ncbi:phosphoribosylformylglycinamidine synthase subunit PurQ [Pelagibacteraceae bacterium]|nr:phosphoribosylformylglycinamidine synthase subunit PurQ [Pelagibacteraceae bacterium]
MNSSVIVFPGSNCDRDIATALTKLQFKNKMIWHKDSHLPKSDLIVIPGGFSYGDYLRSGAIAAKSNILKEVVKAANSGCLVLGICNGFQILIETGLLQGALLRNKDLKFISKDVHLKITSNNNKFCKNYKKNNIISLNIAHNEGNYFTKKDHLKELEDNELIPFKYCNNAGLIDNSTNPNGSLNNIAGILNDKKNILGMMPHPERMVDNLISNSDGIELFTSILN